VLYRHTVVALPPQPPVQAVSFTAVGARDYWVLAAQRCATRRCFTVLRTTNGGRSFVRLAAPPLPASGVTPVLRFADGRDGFAYVPGVGGRFYATHDGGRTWARRSPGTVLAFATGGGNVYLVTGRCTPLPCTEYRFARASVAGGAWTSRRLPFVPAASTFDLAAHGSRVWLLGAPRLDRHDALARSDDGGRTFVVARGPCYSDLGGRLEPTSAAVVWAICPTGLLAGAWRSVDGGARFVSLRTGGLVNSAALAPASDTTAVVAADGAGAGLRRTEDGGATWRPVGTRSMGDIWLFVGFTDGRVGAAIAGNGVLWRTTDGGATWGRVRLAATARRAR
jgi:photosystem II stability/assembly factor-like uncharacterized protein